MSAPALLSSAATGIPERYRDSFLEGTIVLVFGTREFMPATQSVEVYTDGAARGNPGQSAIGYAVYDHDGKIIDKDSKAVGVKTNNQAEYEAFVWALERVVKMGAKEAAFYSDSELLVKQVNGRYRIKDLRLRDLHDLAQGYIDSLDKFEIEHVSRENERTSRVDAMLNKELDEYER